MSEVKIGIAFMFVSSVNNTLCLICTSYKLCRHWSVVHINLPVTVGGAGVHPESQSNARVLFPMMLCIPPALYIARALLESAETETVTLAFSTVGGTASDTEIKRSAYKV